MEHSQSKTNGLNLLQIPEADHYVVAFSGGSDSTALLHALSKRCDLHARLSALHINHQVHSDSYQWSDHCRQFCLKLTIPLAVETIKTQKTDENSLRDARRNAFTAHLDKFDQSVILLTAHHLHDNIETMLFRLLRGSGLNGLTGMHAMSGFQQHTIHRPLLLTPKSDIEHYLQVNRLHWIDDPSNTNDSYDRNFIRNQIIPVLLQYRPDAIEQIAQSRENIEASLQLLGNLIGTENPLKIDNNFDSEQLSTTLYHWLTQKNLPPVHRRQLHSFATSCLTASNDKQPQLDCDDYVLIKQADKIYALRPHLLSTKRPKSIKLNIKQLPFHWQHDFGQLQITGPNSVETSITLSFNPTGEKIQIPSHNHHNRVKEVLRAAGIPTWERTRLPYIYKDNKLLAVGNFISVQGQDWIDQHQLQFSWHSCHYLL